jgi:hypothetical protein
VAMMAEGLSLRAATVAASHAGLTVSAVTAVATRVTFNLQADESVPIGTHALTFTTSLGAVEVPVEVYPRLPVLALEPRPLVLLPGMSLPLDIRFDVADIFHHSFAVTVADVAVGTTSPAEITIPAGALEPTEGVVLETLAPGTTRLSGRTGSEPLFGNIREERGQSHFSGISGPNDV